jgi:hypothetical protein
VAARRIAIDFDASVGDARRLAELVGIAAGLVDPDSVVWTEKFRPMSFDRYSRVRVKVDAKK